MRKKDNQPITVTQLESVLDKRFEQFGRLIVSQLMEYMDVRVGAIEVRLDRVEKRMDTIENTVATMANTLDWLVGAYKKFEEEHMILTTKYTSVQNRLDNHEERLLVLEK